MPNCFRHIRHDQRRSPAGRSFRARVAAGGGQGTCDGAGGLGISRRCGSPSDKSSIFPHAMETPPWYRLDMRPEQLPSRCLPSANPHATLETEESGCGVLLRFWMKTGGFFLRDSKGCAWRSVASKLNPALVSNSIRG